MVAWAIRCKTKTQRKHRTARGTAEPGQPPNECKLASRHTLKVKGINKAATQAQDKCEIRRTHLVQIVSKGWLEGTEHGVSPLHKLISSPGAEKYLISWSPGGFEEQVGVRGGDTPCSVPLNCNPLCLCRARCIFDALRVRESSHTMVTLEIFAFLMEKTFVLVVPTHGTTPITMSGTWVSFVTNIEPTQLRGSCAWIDIFDHRMSLLVLFAR